MSVNHLIVHFVFVLAIFFSGCQIKNNELQNRRKMSSTDLINVNKSIVARDAMEIDEFIKAQKWEMNETATGLRYKIIKTGKGDFAKKGKVIDLKYKVSLLDGTLCYSSDETGVKSFLIGQGGVEAGLEEGVLLLQKGAQAIFIMPPYLAHGLVGDDDRIPTRSSILYELEVMDIKDKVE